MFRALRLPGKMVFAALPLVIALVAVSTLLVWQSFLEADRARQTAVLAGSLDELSAILSALQAEAEPFIDAAVGVTGDSDLRSPTDQSIASFRGQLARMGTTPLLGQVDRATASLAELRELIDRGVTASDAAENRIPAAYEAISDDMLAVMSLMPVETASVEAGRRLEALAAFARLRLAAGSQDRVILNELPETDSLGSSVERVRNANVDIVGWLSVFETTADGDLRARFEASGVPEALRAAEERVQILISRPSDGLEIQADEWVSILDARWDSLITFEVATIRLLVDDSAADSATAFRNAWIVAAGAMLAILAAAISTSLVARSIVRRVRTVTERARQVAQDQLPALVEVLRDPHEEAVLPAMPPIRDRGADEVGELARSFAAMQSTLEDVARQQLETLRRGVADMFVTLARRNRSLIDRQLALIDQLEAHEEDPDSLADFYRLDHIATRMRRNAESLLVLAGNDSPRPWLDALDVDDVVRAAVGEVEDYRRVDILALERVRVRGAAVADLSHLLSELLENATSFSPPDSRVRVAGHFHDEGYLLTVSDRGVGLGDKRLTDANRLLAAPPVVGLALEPTLGLYVVAMLAKRHGIRVRLVSGAPGITAQVMVPKSLFEMEPTHESDAPSPPAEFSAHDAGADRRGLGDQRWEERAVPVEPPPGPILERRESASPVPTPDTDTGSEREAEEVASTDLPQAGQPASGPASTAGLPTRVPGTSFVEATPDRPVTTSAASADGVRTAFASFQSGRDRATDARRSLDLPSRVPGTFLDDEDPGSGGIVTAPSTRGPDAIKSTLSAFQTGLEAGRRRNTPEEGDQI